MSLASDYAAAYAASKATFDSTVATAPPSFSGPNGRAEVTTDGNLRLIKTTQGDFEIPPQGALAFAQWVTSTFG